MTSMLVRFEQPNQVVDFVNTISLFDYDADIKYGRQIWMPSPYWVFSSLQFHAPWNWSFILTRTDAGI